MTIEEAIEAIERNRPTSGYTMLCEALDIAIAALRAQQEAGRYRFFYCESEDSYLLGARVDNFYYAHWYGKSFVWDMSRYLPWGEHVVRPDTAWKEHTYPSEPKEISPDEWFRGFLAKQQELEKNEPLTNADRIRAMSDEELAEFLDKVHDFPCEACCDNMDRCLRNNAPEPVCKRHYLDWLQQTAEEGM